MPDILDQALHGLSDRRVTVVKAVFEQCSLLLDCNPRFKYFTLHGKTHLENLFRILFFLRSGDISLSEDQLFYLALAICVHDLGMVSCLREVEILDLSQGKGTFPDPTIVETFIRDAHHLRIDTYYQDNFGFLTSIGLTVPQLEIVKKIGQAHRKIRLRNLSGMVMQLAALLRVIDELDITPERAPVAVYQNIADELDPTSNWHWFKHNITSGWTEKHNVHYQTHNSAKKIIFDLIVNPPSSSSIAYWLHQVRRPIYKALEDEEARSIIREEFGVEININAHKDMSTAINLDKKWLELEKRALSSNRKSVMLIDDESRKMEDLMIPTMDEFSVQFASSAKDALEKLDAQNVDLCVIDMQISAGGLWTAKETSDFKATGINLCREIASRYPGTKMAILTGTRHHFSPPEGIKLEFVEKKPIDPYHLREKIQRAIL